MPEQTDPVREAGHLAGIIHEHLNELINNGVHPIRDYANGVDFRAAYSEEGQALGYADDDPEIIIVRESDGVFFEVELDVTVRRLETPAVTAEASEGTGAGPEDECDGGDRDGGFPIIPVGRIDAEVTADVRRLTSASEGSRP